MSFFLFKCFICAIHYVFPSLSLRVSSANAFQTIFCVVFPAIEICSKFLEFSELTLSIPFVLTFYMLCVTFASYPVRIKFNVCVSN